MGGTTVLPSIHDMFPDHLLGSSYASTSRLPQLSTQARVPQAVVGPVRVEHSTKRKTSHSRAVPRRPSPHSATSDEEEDESGGVDDRRHPCSLCGKRFNRPSSLRIHMNTHTGATPFQCPYPNCGRTFNVNSNMRRHYRNHTSSTSGSGSSKSSSASPTLAPKKSPRAAAGADAQHFAPRSDHNRPLEDTARIGKPLIRLQGPGVAPVPVSLCGLDCNKDRGDADYHLLFLGGQHTRETERVVGWRSRAAY